MSERDIDPNPLWLLLLVFALVALFLLGVGLL